MNKIPNPAEKSLANFMSELSERCYTAGWMQNLEYVLWDTLINGERKYGQDKITQEDINILKKLSEAAKCWIVWDDKNWETPIDLNAWKEKYQIDTNGSNKLLEG